MRGTIDTGGRSWSLAYYNGWSREQLAEKFDTPLNTVKTWLRRKHDRDAVSRSESGEMTYSEDHIALAAEYALGTRRRRTRFGRDHDDRRSRLHGCGCRVEHKLAPLHQMVGSASRRTTSGITSRPPQDDKQADADVRMPVYVPRRRWKSRHRPTFLKPAPAPVPSRRRAIVNSRRAKKTSRARAEIEAAVRAAQPPKVEPDIVVAPCRRRIVGRLRLRASGGTHECRRHVEPSSRRAGVRIR